MCCCCCCSKSTGAKIVGIVELISALVSLILAGVYVNYYGQTVFIIRLLYSLLNMWFSILLLSGVQKKHKKLVYAWLVWAASNIFLFFISLLIILIFSRDISDKLEGADILPPVFSLIIICGIHCIFTYVVYNYYKEIIRESLENTVENSEAPIVIQNNDSSQFPNVKQVATVSGTIAL